MQVYGVAVHVALLKYSVATGGNTCLALQFQLQFAILGYHSGTAKRLSKSSYNFQLRYHASASE